MEFIRAISVSPTPDGFKAIVAGCGEVTASSRSEVFAVAMDAVKDVVTKQMLQGETPEKFIDGPGDTYVMVDVDKLSRDGLKDYFQEDYVTGAQAARELGITHGRVTQLMDNGVLDAILVGNRRKILRSSLEEYKRLATGRDEKYLTQMEVAARLDVSRAWVWNLVNEGELEYVMVGKRKKIPYSSLERYMRLHGMKMPQEEDKNQ